MAKHTRRLILKAGALAGAATPVARVAIAQADTRPTVNVAVQQILSSNTLEPLREQSNVGTRVANFYLESMIEQDLQDNLKSIPGLATEWKRVDERTVELRLRPGVRFHNGDEMTADDVVYSIGGWAAHDDAAIHKMLRLGVDVFTSDRPTRAVSLRAAGSW
ncbi:MAG: hypothetical protein FJX57_08445 [Alphaproteobacteria bacterium]|nr:hypothetical protein [Alphaproteobacteria bacterium]